MTVWEGNTHCLFFFLSVHSTISKPLGGKEVQKALRQGASRELWSRGVLVPSAGPSAKRDAKATQEEQAAPQLFCHPKSAITTLYARDISRKIKRRLLGQTATNQASFSWLEESQRTFILQQWLPPRLWVQTLLQR